MRWMKRLRGLRRDDGVTAIEYGLIAAGVGLASIAALNLLGDGLKAVYVGAVAAPGLATCASGATCQAYGALATPSFSSVAPIPETPSPTATGSVPAWPTAAPCAPLDLGTQTVVKGQVYSANVFTVADPDVSGAPSLTAATATGDTSGEGVGSTPWSWAPSGTVTWTSPNANGKKVTFTLTYRANSCAGSSTITMKVQAKNA